MKRRWALLLTALCSAAALGCGGNKEVIEKAGEGKSLTDAQIDQDPLALMPGGPVGMTYVDAQQLFQSKFGDQLLRILQKRMPVPAAAGFEPKRDLEKLYVGFYSMSGADAAGVAVGNFNPTAIEAAADGTTNTPLGAPLVKREYAGRTLFVSMNIGFTVLTPRTVIFGNETGIRRMLDRMEDGRVKRQVPSWMGDLLETPNAAVVGGADLEDAPAVASASDQLPFLKGMKSSRMVGNFKDPGMNLAGTSSYTDEEAAVAGAQQMNGFQQLMQSISWLTALLGMGNPIQRLEAKADGTDAKFVAELNGTAVTQVIDQVGTFLGVPPQPTVIRATTTPGITPQPGQPAPSGTVPAPAPPPAPTP